MSVPRIAWLTPFSQGSDIGAFSRCLLSRFASDEPKFDCHLFINENGKAYPAALPSIPIPGTGSLAELLRTYDAAIFNIGNNAENHGRITDILRRVPGIAVLHDYSYHHLFAYECFERRRSPAAYMRLLHSYYGSEGFNLAMRSNIASRNQALFAPWDSDHVANLPLLEPMIGLASALVVHSKFMEEKVRPIFNGPVLRLFLSSDQKLRPSEEAIAAWRERTLQAKTCLFAGFGHISRAKCYDVVLRAVAESPTLRSKAHIIFAGRPGDRDYVRELEAIVASLGLARQVMFEFDITDARLLAIKSEADVLINLRFPNTEGASGSLVEMLNSAKPVIAYRSGCYADVPEGAALLVERNEGPSGVRRAMEALLADAGRRVEIGKAGHDHVHRKDSREYVRRLKEFIIDHKEVLARRGRFMVPVRDSLGWQQADVLPEDSAWFQVLSRARRTFFQLDSDPDVRSPEIYLTWPMEDLVRLISGVLLQGAQPASLAAAVRDLAQRLDRWSLYKVVSRVRAYQDLCRQRTLSAETGAAFAERIEDPSFWALASRLPPTVIAPLLFIGLLARRWGPSEPDNWVGRMADGLHPCQAILDFIGSDEYRDSFGDARLAHVEEWARRELANPSIGSVRRLAPIWLPDEAIAFTSQDVKHEAFLGQPWHAMEVHGRWSDGPIARLQFSLPAHSAGYRAELTMRLRVVGTAATGKRTITARCKGQDLGALKLENDDFKDWTLALPASLSDDEGIKLELAVDRAISPKELGISNDSRSLGIMISRGVLALKEAKGQGRKAA